MRLESPGYVGLGPSYYSQASSGDFVASSFSGMDWPAIAAAAQPLRTYDGAGAAVKLRGCDQEDPAPRLGYQWLAMAMDAPKYIAFADSQAEVLLRLALC